MLFSEMQISSKVKEAIKELGFDEPTKIQEEAIPYALEGKDVIGQAQTGTGKTFSFAIPMVEKIESSNPSIQGIVVLPTRELALQVYAEFIKLVKFRKDIRVITVYGGQSIERQIKDLKNKPHIVIGTPGRIIDHINRKTLKLLDTKMVVLDEADEMLKMGFIEDIETILKETKEERQTMLFSATMPEQIKRVAKNYLNNPVTVKIEAKTLTVDRIKQYYFEVKQASKIDLLMRLLDYNGFSSAIVFCNTKKEVDDVVLALQKNEYMVDGLHGDLKQMVRDRVMNAFRSGSIKILVATDVAARGIDVSGVEVVFNFDLPLEDESYVHRIGRTGRAGKTGISMSFVNGREKTRMKMIEKYAKTKMEKMEIPTIEDLTRNRENVVYQKIVDSIQNPSHHTKIINKLLAEGYDGIDIINALIDIQLSTQKKEYKEIEVEKRREERNRKDDRNHKDQKSSKPSRKEKILYYHINVGKNEGMRPQILLPLIEKLVRCPKDAIGDIKIRKSGTTFEVRSDVESKIKKLNGKTYKNIILVLKKVNGLD